jgi:signal transduction histidine kinase/CheY-like chemotaxis protein
MRVQTKITLLLALVVMAFLGGLFAFRLYDRAKSRAIAQQRLHERRESFEKFLDHNGAAHKALVEDYSCWDQMVDAVAKNDAHWLTENINRSTLDSFHIQAIWIFRADGTPIYPLTYADFADLERLPIARSELGRIFAQGPLAHFFLNSPYGLMEIRAATIHPSKDFVRATPARGFIFAGRLWNPPTLDEMSIFTGNRIRLTPVSETPRTLGVDARDGAVTFVRPLQGWDGQPIAELLVRNESPVVQEFNRRSDNLVVCLIAFAVNLLLLLSISLWRWVRRPLARIMAALSHNDPARIEPMCDDNSEFGELARTVRQFFAQRDALLLQMEERRAAEETLRKNENELRQSQKMEAIGRLAGGVAHDFNNLLTAIIGYAEIIRTRATRDPLVRQDAGLICQAGEQAATLTRQLLAFSRKQFLQPKVLDLNALVAGLHKLLERVIGENFQLRAQLDAVDARVRADPTQLEQVILNLCVNARDAIPTGGTVTIRTSNEHVDLAQNGHVIADIKEGDYVVLSVIDTGIGMNAETKRHIFEPFYTTKEAGKGTGLGLATVYGIVRQSGGGILVESEVGMGTTIRIYLPHAQAAIEYVATPTRSDSISAASRSSTLLVVEDDDAVRQLVCDVLEENGYTVLCATKGADAVRIADRYEHEIDLLVTDVVMPGMNGPELASRLSFSRPEMRVLYVSGYSADEMGDHGVADLAVQYLPKPFSPHTLVQRVRKILATTPWSLDGDRADIAQLQLSI